MSTGPAKLPQHFAGRRVVRRQRAGKDEHLTHTTRHLDQRRAIALPAFPGRPTHRAVLRLIGNQRTIVAPARIDVNQIVHHQRRAGEAPVRHAAIVLPQNILRPQCAARREIQTAQPTRRTLHIDTLTNDRGCRARTFTSQRREVTRRVRVRPQGASRGEIVGDDGFTPAALFLRNGKRTRYHKSRPRGADWLPPLKNRWLRQPVRREARAGEDAVARRPEELGEIRGTRDHAGRSIRGHRRRDRQLTSRPAELQNRDKVSIHTMDAKQRRHQTHARDAASQHREPHAPGQPRERKQPDEQRAQREQHHARDVQVEVLLRTFRNEPQRRIRGRARDQDDDQRPPPRTTRFRRK